MNLRNLCGTWVVVIMQCIVEWSEMNGSEVEELRNRLDDATSNHHQKHRLSSHNGNHNYEASIVIGTGGNGGGCGTRQERCRGAIGFSGNSVGSVNARLQIMLLAVNECKQNAVRCPLNKGIDLM